MSVFAWAAWAVAAMLVGRAVGVELQQPARLCRGQAAQRRRRILARPVVHDHDGRRRRVGIGEAAQALEGVGQAVPVQHYHADPRGRGGHGASSGAVATAGGDAGEAAVRGRGRRTPYAATALPASQKKR